MFEKIKKHFNPATAVALVALVFAATGVSFAATGGGGKGNKNNNPSLVASTAKSKGKTGPRGAKGPAGPAGKNGTNGVNGAPGATGPAGAKGETGAAGVNGTGTEGKEGKPGKEGPEGSEGSEGPAGAIHPGETLPSKASETGAWGVTAPVTGGPVVTPVSFTIPLAAAITSSKNSPAEEHAFFIPPGETPSTQCPGTAAKPEAAPGEFCAYAEELGSSLTPFAFGPPIENPSAGLTAAAGTATSGAILVFTNASTETEFGYGTWAVTAP